VHEIVEELLRATIANNAAVVARCIMQLECINRENAENDQVSGGEGLQVSRKRSVSDDHLHRLNGARYSSRCNYPSASTMDAHSESLEAGRSRRPLKPLARSVVVHHRDHSYAKGATTTPQGTSLDAKIAHSAPGRMRPPRRDLVEESARCANWPKCLAGPAMIRDHGESQKIHARRTRRIMSENVSQFLHSKSIEFTHLHASSERYARLVDDILPGFVCIHLHRHCHHLFTRVL